MNHFYGNSRALNHESYCHPNIIIVTIVVVIVYVIVAIIYFLI